MQRVHQRDILQVHLDAFAGVVRIEEHIDAGYFAHGLIDHLRVFKGVNGDGLIRYRLQIGGRSDVAQRRITVRHRCLASRTGGNLLLGALDVLLGQFVAGVDLERAGELRQRSTQVALVAQLLALMGMHRRCGELEPLVGGLVVEVGRLLLVCGRERVIGGEVVVLRLGDLTLVVEGLRRLALRVNDGDKGREREQDQDGEKPA